MNTLKLIPEVPDNLIEVNFKQSPPRKTTSLFKSDGKPKATAADPIRNLSDISALQAYFKSKNQHRNYLLITMGVIFGLRAGDLLSIRLHHIFNADGTFKEHCDIIESKTRKFNNPPITPQLQSAITDYLTAINKHLSYDDPLFISNKRNADGTYRPITITQFDRILKAACKECKISGHISSHSMRKTFAYQMLKQNPNDDEAKFAVQKMLNHNDFKTTLTYCGITQDTVDDYRNKFEGVIMC